MNSRQCRRADHHALLAAVVLAHADGVDPVAVIAEQPIDHRRANRLQSVEQLVGEGRMEVKIHHQVLHAAA